MAEPLVLAVRAEPFGGVVEVRDGGPGLTDDDLGVAFEPAVLHDRYRGLRQVGTGVGLALVGRLAQRLGGPAGTLRPGAGWPTLPGMSPRSRRLVAPLAVAAVTICATAYVGLVDPNQPGHYPLCPTKALTGLDCPGCGGLRATHALVTGDLVGALDHNAFVVLVVIPLAVVAWAAWLVRCWRGPEQQPAPDPFPAQYAAVGPAGRGTDPAPVGAAAPAPVAASGWSDPRLMWVLLAIALAFTVVRNVDAVPALQWLGSGVGTS